MASSRKIDVKWAPLGEGATVVLPRYLGRAELLLAPLCGSLVNEALALRQRSRKEPRVCSPHSGETLLSWIAGCGFEHYVEVN